jgi:hypothetical protein
MDNTPKINRPQWLAAKYASMFEFNVANTSMHAIFMAIYSVNDAGFLLNDYSLEQRAVELANEAEKFRAVYDKLMRDVADKLNEAAKQTQPTGN